MRSVQALAQGIIPTLHPTLRGNPWVWGAALLALLVLFPIGAVLWVALAPSGGIWLHLANTVLAEYLLTTAALCGMVAGGTFLIGVGNAWLVTMCRFPGRGVYEWALLLPLAMPAYILAFTYTEFLDFAGPVQALLRELFGWRLKREYWFPEIRSLGGASVFMTLVLYPYVYLLARSAFLAQSVAVLEASRSLGRGPWGGFFHVALPLARPAWMVGIALVVMETLNDLGTVEFFAVPTFTVGIFRVWFGLNNAPAAAQLASIMVLGVLVLLLVERQARKGARFDRGSAPPKYLPRYQLGGKAAGGAVLICSLPVLLGFLLPVGLLVSNAQATFGETFTPRYLKIVGNTLLISGLAALACLAVGVFIAYGQRLQPGKLLGTLARLASIGYAVPGAVLALGILIPNGWLDNLVDSVLRREFGISSGLLISGTLTALLMAYVVRFLALSLGAVESGLSKITPSMDDAARSLGHGPGANLVRVHLPLLKGSLLTGGILVFVDVMKELPMTLVLRPFNFETLATLTYEYASLELLEESALPALTIVIAGLMPVLILSRSLGRSRT